MTVWFEPGQVLVGAGDVSVSTIDRIQRVEDVPVIWITPADGGAPVPMVTHDGRWWSAPAFAADVLAASPVIPPTREARLLAALVVALAVPASRGPAAPAGAAGASA